MSESLGEKYKHLKNQKNCPYCDKVINNYVNLGRHIEQIHENTEEVQFCTKCSKLKEITEFYKTRRKSYGKICKECVKTSKHNTEIINCPICGNKTYKKNLRCHQTSLRCQLKRMQENM